MVLQGIKDKEKQGDKEARGQRRRVDVTREIWEDPGKIQGRSRGRCDREGERNKVEKRREDMRGGRGCYSSFSSSFCLTFLPYSLSTYLER